MSVVKVIELYSESDTSWEDAAQAAVTEAAKTIKNIKSVYIQDQKAVVEGDKIVKFRCNVKLSFIVEN